VKLIEGLGAEDELTKVKESKKLRCGKGKMRNRRYVMRKGPLVVHANKDGLERACKNIPGVDTCHVERMNLLKLAPGGRMGRMVIYTEEALKTLNSVWGTYKSAAPKKKGYHLLRPAMTNTDLARIINSDEIQSVVTAAKQGEKTREMKRNPLKNRAAMAKLNPGMNQRRKLRQLAAEEGNKKREEVVAKKRATAAGAKKHHKASSEFYNKMMAAYEVKPEAAADEDEE